MLPINVYPYLNLNDLNLDFVMKAIADMKYEVTNFVSINAIKYANPIQWNITSQYEKNTIVIDPVTGTAYISVAPVPAGVALTRPEYWTVVFDLGSFVTRAAQNFTDNWESDTTTTATFASNVGDWLVWGDVLYKVISPITAGDTYVVNSNIEHFTIEDLYNTYLNTIAQILAMIGDLNNLITPNTSDLVNALNSVWTKVGGAPLNTVAQNLSDAVNELDSHLGNTPLQTVAQNVSDAVNEILHYDNLYGKKFYFGGDSIMYGLLPDSSQSAFNFPKVFADLTGATVNNDAINGAAITNYDANSFCNRVASIDFTQYDYAVLQFGFNDVGHGVNLYGSTTNDFDYAYKYCLDTMLTSNPELKIVLCSPTFTPNAMGRYAPSNICAQDVYYVIRDIALEYNLPFVDFEYGAGINAKNASTYQWDGLHFNDVGYKALGEFLARNFLQSAPMLQAMPLAQTIDTGIESSGYRITFDQSFGNSGVCLAFITNENSKCMNISLVTKSGYSVSFEYNGEVDQWQFKAGFINLHPDASTAVSCALDRITPTGFTGQVFWYGNTGNLTILSVPI